MSQPARPVAAKLRADPAYEGFELKNSPFYLMAQANGIYTQLMERSLKSVGMDLPRWRVLMVLHEKNPSTMSEISARAVMKLSTMTKVAQRLEQGGFVALASNEQDRRVTDVHLLHHGEVAVDTIRRVASSVYARATSDFSDAEISAFTQQLDKLTRNLMEAE